MKTIDNYMVKKDNSDGCITLELKSDQPGKYFLNGKPMTVKHPALKGDQDETQ